MGKCGNIDLYANPQFLTRILIPYKAKANDKNLPGPAWSLCETGPAGLVQSPKVKSKRTRADTKINNNFMIINLY